MLRFEAAFFILAMEEFKAMAETIKDSDVTDNTEDGKKLVNQLLDKMSKDTAILPSASDFRLKIHMLKERLKRTTMTAQELGVYLLALHQDICAELLKPVFLLIPEQR